MVENWFKNKLNIIISISCTVFIFLVISGSWLNKEKKVVVNNKIRLAELNRDLNHLDKILVEEKENRQKIKTVSETLPSNYEEVAFFAEQVENTGKKKNQDLELKIDKVLKDEKDGLSSLKFDLKSSGTYSTFSEMLSQIAQFPYHTKFDSIKMQKIEGGGISTITTLRLLMTQK